MAVYIARKAYFDTTKGSKFKGYFRLTKKYKISQLASTDSTYLVKNENYIFVVTSLKIIAS